MIYIYNMECEIYIIGGRGGIMEKNKLGYLGYLGFIGVLGLWMGSFAHIAFLIFFFFFTYSNVIPDELFKENIKKSALNAFKVNMIINTSIMILASIISIFHQFITPNSSMIFFGLFAFVLNYVISLLVFVFTLIHYGHKEKRELELK